MTWRVIIIDPREDELKEYLFHLRVERKPRFGGIYQAVHALRRFYTLTLQRPVEPLKAILVVPKVETRRPEVLSIEEVERLLIEGRAVCGSSVSGHGLCGEVAFE